MERLRSGRIKYVIFDVAKIFESSSQIFESWGQILATKSNIWQILMSNLEVKQIDNINYIFLERSRSGWIKYVVFDIAGPKYSSPEAK